eukprot:TRINITY_DN3231_c4_g1_i1.p1 TRINITY_DN3231_c4_g1~~TRINITY_DN3231_c4_g1_i1.p1  ORF type:complete len:350 (+),score=55.71 TRINITY_DN3231_c4_g1_i1:74-1123(+)
MAARRLAYGSVGAAAGFLFGGVTDFCKADTKNYTLLSIPAMEGLAEEVASSGNGMFTRGKLNMETFSDGTPKCMVDTKAIAGKDVILLADYNLKGHGADWVATLGIIYALPRYGCTSLTVVLPFFPMGTMERVSVEGEIATAMTFTRMLSATPLTKRGPVNFVFYDIHALQNRFYFEDGVLPHLTTAIPLLKKEITKLTKQGKEVAIAFPDDGAMKRFGHEFVGEYPLIVCSKTRENNRRFLKITEGREDVKGKHVIIVDDLVQSGGTMTNCKDLMLSEGAQAVSGYVTHGVFPNQSWKKFLTENSKLPWANFWITNSIPASAKEISGVPFKVLSLSDCIVDYFDKQVI